MSNCVVAPSGSTMGESGASSCDHLSPAAPDVGGSSLSSPAPRAWLTSARRPRTSPGPQSSALRGVLLSDDDTRRDSALASSHCTAHDPPSPHSLHKTPSLPAIVVHDGLRHDNGGAFAGLDTVIPTGDLDDLTSTSHLAFTKRGSMLLGGKKANRRSRAMGRAAETMPIPSTPPPPPPPPPVEEAQTKHQELTPPAPTLLTPRSTSRYTARGRSTSGRVLSTDEMMLSRKVRTMYKHGDESAVNWDAPDEDTSSANTSGFLDNSSVLNTPANTSSLTVDRSRDDSKSFVSSRRGSVIIKTVAERAGGLEDWTDLQGGEVDRYGFIIPRKTRSKEGANGEGLDGPDEPRLQRVTTSLQLVAQEPRRRHIGRSLSRARSVRSTDSRTESSGRRASWKSVRPSRSIFSSQTADTRTTQKPLRHMTNKLPHNRERRMLDEASDMLKLPPGLAEVAERREGGRAAQAMRAKEIQRDEKWRKMAKVVTSGASRGGMLFEFDVKDSKVVSRTWKGIPDRWRATAWYSFLAASAEKDPDSPSEGELIESFHELQGESSAEDVQIDVDVPRTINRHIMFRRRYRGGQRLLFRVLHAMSLYLPETGYVQGMAALAATLLCYYEEDRAFVMLVRLWMLRGLERLYESGFSGLTDALEDFEQNWLCGGDVAQKLEDLDIHPTAWGTRWYLTLFNYSLPFPAQLRIWDVFMLLGDKSYSSSPSSKFSGDLDVLHATSAALIDATREILLDSDFENAMKVLTSWIPIKDEELLMRVAKAEYRMRKKRANA